MLRPVRRHRYREHGQLAGYVQRQQHTG